MKIKFKAAETAVVDILQDASRWETKIHKHGLIALIDVMPRLVPEGKTTDSAIVQAARVSYGEGTKKIIAWEPSLCHDWRLKPCAMAHPHCQRQ